MRDRTRRAFKRRIPNEPGKSQCKFTFEVDGENVLMRVDCIGACTGESRSKDVCWSNLVRAISESAVPDRIILLRESPLICDRILVALMRNAAQLITRASARIDDLNSRWNGQRVAEADRLREMIRAILYDIPQLIVRDFERSDGNDTRFEEAGRGRGDFSIAGEILSRKRAFEMSDGYEDLARRASMK